MDKSKNPSFEKKRIESVIEYELIKEIGKGSFARVYVAKRIGEALDRYVAVKVVDLEGMNDRQRTIIRDEARITGTLSHPNILHIYDCGMVGDRFFFIASELLDGYNLREVINRHTRRVMDRLKGMDEIPVSLMKHAAASILMHAAHGLQYIHTARDVISGKSLKVIHNDLKPSNILIGINGSLKVSDFGISTSPLRTVRLKGGTPAYMSPEWIEALLDDESKIAPEVSLDIYSLGVCLHETLTARRLFKARREGLKRKELLKDMLGQMKEFKPGTTLKINPAADPLLCSIVDRCLRLKPTERFASVQEIIDEIDAAISEGALHPEIMDRRFLSEYVGSLFPEGGLKRIMSSNSIKRS